MSRVIALTIALALAAACEFQQNPNEPSPTTDVYYTAIGASDAIGFGSSVVCLPFSPCPNGMGYVQSIVRQLQAAGKTVTHLNLGIPGAVLGSETQALGNSLGRDIFGNFLDQEVPFVPRETTVVTVFAGGNDVNTVGAALEAGLGGANPTAFIQTHTQNFARDMQRLLTGVRDRAPNTRLVVINLPNMAAMPYANGYTLTQKRALQQIAVAFSAQVNALVAQGAIIIDLMCDAAMYQPQMFSSDGFHPNDAGYARLATLTFAATSTGAATPPRASCSQMTVF